MIPILKRLDEIRARAEKATPGPWVYHWPEWKDDYVHPDYVKCGEDHPPICEVTDGVPNATFIAHARQDVPALEAALRIALKGIYHDGCDGGMRCGGCDLETEIAKALGAGE